MTQVSRSFLSTRKVNRQVIFYFVCLSPALISQDISLNFRPLAFLESLAEHLISQFLFFSVETRIILSYDDERSFKALAKGEQQKIINQSSKGSEENLKREHKLTRLWQKSLRDSLNVRYCGSCSGLLCKSFFSSFYLRRLQAHFKPFYDLKCPRS